MKSPIFSLEYYIKDSIYKIAPENKIELDSWCKENDFKIELVEKNGFNFKVSIKNKKVKLPIAALEYLWAATHTYIVLYDEYTTAQKNGAALYDTGGNQRRKNSIDLIKWAHSNMFLAVQNDWPNQLPCPISMPIEGSDVHVTNELFLCAIAWILHHEIAHIKLGHPDIETIISLKEEREADEAATTWILHKSNNDKEYKKKNIRYCYSNISYSRR